MKATLTIVAGLCSLGLLFSAPPAPEGFAGPESPPLPEPFPIKYQDQGVYDQRLKGLFAPEGFKVEIVAENPVVVNPVGITFGPDGTLFVIEWKPDPGREWFELKETFTFQDGTSRQVATMKKFVTDPVKALHYNPETGTYDRSDVIIPEELPSTLLWHDGWLYTASRGTVRRYKQSRAGGPWDIREVIAQGFCGFHHHQVSGLTIGNDGWLYITSGDDDNFAEGSDGSRATVLRTGAIFRCKPDGSEMEIFSIGYRNPYRDMAYDDKFNWFHADNDNEDGSKFTGCRLMHVTEGSDYGWRLLPGARCCRPDFVRGAIAGELPGKLPPMLKTGRGSPAGLLIYHDTKIPEQYRGLLYYPDVFRRLVRAYGIKPNGSSFDVVSEFEFLKSDDPLFRPCEMVTGPDGAIYVCDWRTDSGGAGKLWGDGQNGRIYRITWVGTEDLPGIPTRGLDSWAKLIRKPTEELIAALGSPDLTDRVEARKELVRRGTPARDAILKSIISGTLEPDGRLAALGALQAHWSNEVEALFILLLNDNSPDIRRLAADGLGRNAKPGNARVQESLVKIFADEEPAVRRSVAMAIGRIGAPGAADVLLNAWRADTAADFMLADGYIRAIESLGKPGFASLLSLAASGEAADLERVVNAIAGCRTMAGYQALPELLSNPHLKPEQKIALVRSFPNYQFDPPVSFEPLVEFMTTTEKLDPAVVAAGLEVLSETGNINSPEDTALVLKLLDAKEPELQLAAIRTANSSRIRDAGPKLIAIADDNKMSQQLRTEAVKALASTGGPQIDTALTNILQAEVPTALKREALRSLATVAPEQARTAAEKLLKQPDLELLAEAVAVLGSSKQGAQTVGEKFLAGQLPKALLPRVTEVLGKFRDDEAIAKLSGEVMKGGLSVGSDPASVDRIRKLVLTQGDPLKGKQLYLNTKLLACANCHQLEGSGGNIGPDLTRVWDTQTIDKLIEAIIEPSKEIKEGYQTYKAATIDGRVFTGLRITDTDTEVVIREANGTDVRLLKDDLDELTPLQTSLMPDNVVSQLTFDQFIDLIAFLKNRQAQESLRGNVLTYMFATGLRTNQLIDWEKAELPDGIRWQLSAAEPNGLVQTEAKPGVSYALTWVYSPNSQKAVANLKTNAKNAELRVNGKPVSQLGGDLHTDFARYPLELNEGWTPVIVKLVTQAGELHFGIVLEGQELKSSAQPLDSPKK